MPIYKYIIQTENTDQNKAKNENEFDANAFANQRLVNIIRHLSQLVKIANDVFGTIENECKSTYERTTKLSIKIQHCQEIVDNLNAKAVKVPAGSLSDFQTQYLQFKSCDSEKIDLAPIFSSLPRPAAVDKLRDSAHGPSPPVVIPCGMVASEVEDFPGTISSSNSSTHIYCKPVKINNDKCQNSIESGGSNGHNKSMSSEVKVPSNVVAIDVSGQPFSRMSNFRRSLIHVDFLIRRKRKKDKRRNTVAEGDVKDLKDALQKIVTDENQFTLPNRICTYEQIIADSKNDFNSKVCDDQQNEKNSVEQNNNAANIKSSEKAAYIVTGNQAIHAERNKNVLNGDRLKKEPKPHESENSARHQSSNKRKAKSHIPISTISAAMNVAVEMRQCNDVDKETPISNDVSYNNNQSSPESDNKLQEDKRNSNSSYGSQDESWASYKQRLQDKYKTLTHRKFSNGNNLISRETEVSSSTSSENIDHQDDTTTTPTDSDTYFISSDESDDDSTEVVCFQDNCGSSTSLGTVSDGSLNSLLSETGTEMTSSTGTLTSIGHETLVISSPPPPPPPMILSATVKDRDIVEKIQNLTINGNNTKAKSKKYVKTESMFPKQEKQSKLSKPIKTDIFDFQKTKPDISRSIFTSLVSLKQHSKDKNKTKSKEAEKKKVNKSSHHPAFDMYGNNSPSNTKQIPAFIKENISPVMQNEEKSHMKSFLVADKSRNSVIFHEESKLKSDFMPQTNLPCKNDKNISNATKARATQTVNSIPSKYEHQVTVTPVQRLMDSENKNIHHKGSIVTENQQNPRCGSMQKSNCINTDSQIYAPRIQKPHPPVTFLQERSKPAARVTLDFDGKVIYSTNSLDRKNCKPCHLLNTCNSVQNKICESYFKDRQYNDKCYNKLCEENQMQQNLQLLSPTGYNSFRSHPQGNPSMCSSPYVSINHNVMENKTEDDQFLKYDTNSTEQAYCRYNTSPQGCIPETMQTFVAKKTDIRPFSYAGNSSDTYLSNPSNNLLPDPNISGLPIQEPMLTRHNVNLHSKQMEKMNLSDIGNTFNRTSKNFCVSPSSQSMSSSILNKSPQSSMSTEDLFAVIHDCKKRLNIKTDSDISLASSSSRSSSPSYLRPSSSKGTLAETGFLSPRSHVHLETSGDRRSWADFRPVDSFSSERKSLASDRLGPTKPTSMHDFKMLLLQARASSQISGPRKSAVEMLKVPLNQNKNRVPSLSLSSSPRSSLSLSAQNSPTTELNLCNGHSTVPFKRGNRVRTSLQSRYIMYPPIFEDCSEDLENCGDLISNKSLQCHSFTSATNRGDTNQKENSDWKQNSNNNTLQSDQYSCDNERNSQTE